MSNKTTKIEKNGSIQRALEWGALLATEIQKDLADNTITFWEGIALTDNAIQLITVIKDFKKLPEDWECLRQDQNYTNEIIKGMETVLGTVPQKAEAIVQQGIITGLEIAKFVALCVGAKKE